MAPYEEAQAADGKNSKHHRPIAEHRLARKSGKDMRRGAHARKDRYVNLRVTEKPEQVLPQKRGASRVQGKARIARQDPVHVFTGGNEKARAAYAIEKQEDAAAQQHRKRTQG